MKNLQKMFHKKVTPPHKLVNNYLKLLRFQAKTNLIQSYKNIAYQCIKKGQNTNSFIKQLSQRSSKKMKIHHMIKLLTIIHSLTIERQYKKQEIYGLQNLQININIQDNQAWFQEFTKAYITYLIKLPSVCDIYRAAFKKIFPTTQQALTQIFIIINQISLLFPSITKAIQTVGRYKANKFTQFVQFYKIISSQLINIYDYLYQLVDCVIKDYKQLKRDTIQCFVKILPQIELTFDKIQDLLVNKYIKGHKSCQNKIQLKQEQIAKINYYLQHQKIVKKLN